MQLGASARAVATAEGGRGAAAIETRISRKKRKQTLISQYWGKIEELTDLIIKLSPSPTELMRYTDLVKRASPPSAPHLTLIDLAVCSIRHVLDGHEMSGDDRDHVESAWFYSSLITNSDLDNPVRREKLNDRIHTLDAILQELRQKINKT